MAEREISAAILAAFGRNPYLRLWRQGVGAAWIGDGRSRRMVRFGLPGMADLSGILACGRRVEIEVKTETGRLTVDQQRWGAMVAAFGALYAVARSTADVERLLAKHLQVCSACYHARPFKPLED